MSLMRWSGLALLLFSHPSVAADWRLGLEYTDGFIQRDPVASVSLGGQESLTSRWGWFFSQSVAKNFYTDVSRGEWALNDTILGVFLTPRSLFAGIEWAVRISATLPLSKDSQFHEIYSRPELRSTGRYALADGLTLSGTGFVRSLLSRYQTTRGPSGQGGDPLAWLTLGAGIGSQFRLGDGISLGVSGTYIETKFYDSDAEASTQPTVSIWPEQSYSFVLSGEWRVYEHTQISLVYSQGSLLQVEGFADYVLFDEEESLWSLGYGYEL